MNNGFPISSKIVTNYVATTTTIIQPNNNYLESDLCLQISYFNFTISTLFIIYFLLHYLNLNNNLSIHSQNPIFFLQSHTCLTFVLTKDFSRPNFYQLGHIPILNFYKFHLYSSINHVNQLLIIFLPIIQTKIYNFIYLYTYIE